MSATGQTDEQPSDRLTQDDRLAVLFLFEELADELVALGDLWRIARSVRQSVIDARRSKVMGKLGTPAIYCAHAWLFELFRGDGTGPELDGPDTSPGDDGETDYSYGPQELCLTCGEQKPASLMLNNGRCLRCDFRAAPDEKDPT